MPPAFREGSSTRRAGPSSTPRELAIAPEAERHYGAATVPRQPQGFSSIAAMKADHTGSGSHTDRMSEKASSGGQPLPDDAIEPQEGRHAHVGGAVNQRLPVQVRVHGGEEGQRAK